MGAPDSGTVTSVIGFLTIAAAIYGSRRSNNTSDRKTDLEESMSDRDRIDRLERTVQYLRARDLWHVQKEYRLVNAIEAHGGSVPDMPPEPTPEPDLLT